MDDGALIALRNVRFARAQRTVFDKLDLEVRPGERIGLIGHNGSGKTTLLHMIVGLLAPQAGEVRAFGQLRRSDEDFQEVRRRVGLLFQDPEDQLFCPTVGEDVAFGPLNLGWPRQRVRATVQGTLARLGLEGFADRVTYQLSFGEKRLVSLATLLAMEPELLLLDEPTAGLDADVQERITRLLEQLPVPLLVVSHDAEFLRRVTTKRMRLERGRMTAA